MTFAGLKICISE